MLVVLPLLPCRGRRLGGDIFTLDRRGGSDVAHGCAAFVLVVGVARSVGIRFISFPEMPHESCSAAAFSLSALASCASNKTVTIPGRMPALWRSFPSLVQCGSAFCEGYPLPQGPAVTSPDKPCELLGWPAGVGSPGDAMLSFSPHPALRAAPVPYLLHGNRMPSAHPSDVTAACLSGNTITRPRCRPARCGTCLGSRSRIANLSRC